MTCLAAGTGGIDGTTMTDTDSPTRAQTTVTLMDEVLADLIATGDYTMVEAFGVMDYHPRMTYRRLQKDQEFADLMNEAQDIGAETRAARLGRIAAGDVKAGSTSDVKRDTLICKQEAWRLEKAHPKKYGPRVQVETTNRTAQVTISDDPVEAARQYQELISGT